MSGTEVMADTFISWSKEGGGKQEKNGAHTWTLRFDFIQGVRERKTFRQDVVRDTDFEIQ